MTESVNFNHSNRGFEQWRNLTNLIWESKFNVFNQKWHKFYVFIIFFKKFKIYHSYNVINCIETKVKNYFLLPKSHKCIFKDSRLWEISKKFDIKDGSWLDNVLISSH